MTARRSVKWRDVAAALSERLPRERLHPDVLAGAAARPRSEAWAVAFSGGADSVCLLLLLWAHFPARRRFLVVLHFNHRLRGADADADEKFCRRVCASLGVRCVTGAWRQPPARVNEASARAARLDFFAREMKRRRAKVLWTGHQLDDIAETMLMRLARGSGTAGLAAPRPVQRLPGGRVNLRPLLCLAKEELQEALREAGGSWCEDATNAGDDFFRSRVRRKVLPAWRKASPTPALEGAALSRTLLEEDDAALEAWVAELNPVKGGELILARLRGKPRAVWRRALHGWLADVKGQLTREGFSQLLAACDAGRGGSHSLGSGFAVIAGGRLRWRPRDSNKDVWRETVLPLGSEKVLSSTQKVAATVKALNAARRKKIFSGAGDDRERVFVRLDAVGPDGLAIRHWRPGDRYCPLGARRPVKVQNLFVNRGVPREERHRLPVFVGQEDRIVWIPGLPPGHDARILSGTKLAAQLTYTSGTFTFKP